MTTQVSVQVSAQVVGALKGRLDAFSAQVPAFVHSRVDAAVTEIAASGAAPGLSVGDKAPDFTLPDQLGRPVSLQERLSAGSVVLAFYRGEWCPFCNIHLRALQEALPQIRPKGASLLAVSPQAPDHALSITEKAGLGFPVLSDADQNVIRAYKLQFTAPDDLQDLVVNVFKTDLREHTPTAAGACPCPPPSLD